MDPKTSDEEMGRMIGKSTGSALAIIAMSKIGPKGAKAPPGEPPPPPAPKPQTVTQKMPPPAPKTIRDPTMPTGPANEAGWQRIIDKNAGGKLERMKWEAENEARMEKWSNEFNRRVQAARPEMDKMLEETGSARPILKRIQGEVDKMGFGPID